MQGPTALSEMFYAFSSATGNNGSAFAGLNTNTPWYNTTLGLAMLFGRFAHDRPDLGPGRKPGREKTGPCQRREFPPFREPFSFSC